MSDPFDEGSPDMLPIRRVTVAVPHGPLKLTRTFYVHDLDDVNAIELAAAAHGYEFKGYGIDHVMSAAEVLGEIEQEIAAEGV